MYTVQQIKDMGIEVAVWIKNEKEFSSLVEAEFNLCPYMGPHYYGVNKGEYSTLTLRNGERGEGVYAKYSLFEYEDIDFNRTFIPQIFN